LKIDVVREDNFADIVRKASTGLKIANTALAAEAKVAPGRLDALLAERANPTEDEAHSIARVLNLDPQKLADIGCRDWSPRSVELNGELQHQINAPFPSNGYFLISKETKTAAFVDPGGNAEHILRVLERANVPLEYILLTHKHHDHVDAVPELRDAFPSARVVISRIDALEIGDNARGALDAVDGGTIPFGKGEIRVIHTPGHTDGGVCFLYRDMLFTGDTLFAGSVGKLYGPRLGYEDLLNSVATRIFSLPAATVVLPGHGPPSTVEQEREHNPFF
jgi:hydroxyacylglutathione hydrolase